MSEQYSERLQSDIHLPLFDTEHLLARLADMPPDTTSYIHVGGVSASGKSTIARLLKTTLGDSQVLPIDSYLIEGLSDKFFDNESPDPERPYIGGISPDIWDLDLLEGHLRDLRDGKTISRPIFNETIKDRVGYELFASSRFVILEGGHTFSERFRDLAAYRVLVEAPFHDRVTRKLVRTHVIYGRTDMDEILDRYCTRDEPVRQIYQDEHRALADQIVCNPACPERDYANLPPSASPEHEGRFYRLIPKPSYGELSLSEQFGVTVGNGGGYNIFYKIGSKRLVDLPVPEYTVRLLSRYYDIEEA